MNKELPDLDNLTENQERIAAFLRDYLVRCPKTGLQFIAVGSNEEFLANVVFEKATSAKEVAGRLRRMADHLESVKS